MTFVQIMLLAFLSFFFMGYNLRFGMHFVILYSLAMSGTAMSMLLGSSVEDPKLAVEFLPMTFVPQILFSGFFIAQSLIPVWLRWLQYVMPLTYAVKLELAGEFDRDCGSDQAHQNCDSVLDNASVDLDDVWWYWLALLAVFIILRSSALVFLKRKADK